jgi:hypothetical protein
MKITGANFIASLRAADAGWFQSPSRRHAARKSKIMSSSNSGTKMLAVIGSVLVFKYYYYFKKYQQYKALE